MKGVTFEEVVEMLQQLKYTDIKEVDAGIYSAKNPWGEEREFCTILEGKNERLISRRNLFQAMKKHEHIQTFEVEFTSDTNDSIIYIDDYVIEKDFSKLSPIKASSVKSCFYK